MSISPNTGFDWYSKLPDGITCLTSRPGLLERSASVFVHQVPSKTGIIRDCTSDPVISLAWNSDGIIERSIDGHTEKARLEKYHLTLTPADVPCDWRWVGGTLNVADIHVPNSMLQKVWRENFSERDEFVRLKPTLTLHDDSIALLIRSMLCEQENEVVKSEAYHEIITKHLIFQLLSLADDAVSNETLRGVLPRSSLQKVKRHIEDNLSIEISLDELAGIANMSRFHFLRMFKKSEGMTPHAYVIERRMNRAAELLSKTNMSIVDISVECGYEDPSYFSSCFRRRHGVPPTIFRRMK